MRVLITGSRDWDREDVIASELWSTYWASKSVSEDMVLISGGCPTGADFIAEKVAEALGWSVERHPANWGKYGKRAGYIRNQAMVDSNPDICIGFVKDNSRGATMTLGLAEKAGCPRNAL